MQAPLAKGPETGSQSENIAEPVAVIGIGCRFPKAAGPDAFWRCLIEGVDAIGEIPSSRFPVELLYDPRPSIPGRIATRYGGILQDVELFDAEFFGISPREAAWLDPQQRLLLETTWEAIESAGQVPARLRGSNTAVFVGMWLNEYEARMFRDPSRIDFYMTTGTGRYAASGRISNTFGWCGPSVTVDCACSSSLVAVHLACRSLRSGECDLAIAGGANVLLEPSITLAYSQSRMMAPDGRCKFGDARGDGYVRSDGAGIVVLKRLSCALADGDPIVCLIRGSAANNDGGSGGSFGTPGKAGQIDLMRKAYRDAGISPSDVDFIEAHGTGTRAGDPVEVAAIAAVLGEGRSANRPVVIGSVKTNIGHTESAAGVAGLIKAALALQHKTIPRNLHFETPNPDIPWQDLQIEIPRENRPWPVGGRPGIAGVNSFGISGTNAHVVLQRYEATDTQFAPDHLQHQRQELVLLSARSPEALRAMATSWQQWLAGPGATVSLADLAFTTALRREHHEYRLAIVAEDIPVLRERLNSFIAGEPSRGVTEGRREAQSPQKLVFACSGQGSQWLKMGHRLYDDEPVFRQSIDRCNEAIARLAGWSLLDAIFGQSDGAWLDDIAIIQPALFAMQVSLADLWRSWGVEPAAVVGHSMGEVAAACICGALKFDDAVRVICTRSRLMKRVSGLGAMALVELSLEDAQLAVAPFQGRASVAVNNSKRSSVLSGEPQAIEEILSGLEARGIFCRRVKVDVAAHSPQMDSVRIDLISSLVGLEAHPAQIPMISTVTGDFVRGEELGADYWGRNVREPVLFASVVDRLAGNGYAAFLELSPHPVLTNSIRQQLGGTQVLQGAWPSLLREEDDRFVMLETLGGLYSAGFDPDWKRLFPANCAVVALPSYPWQRERHWYDSPEIRTSGSAIRNRFGLGQKLNLAIEDGTCVWEAGFDRATHATYWDHRVAGVATLSAASSLRLVLDAAQTMFGPSPEFLLEDVEFLAPIVLPDEGDAPELQLVLSPQEDRMAAFSLHARSESGWAVKVRGRVSARAESANSRKDTGESLFALRAGCPGGDEYAALARAGVEIGPAMRAVASYLPKDNGALAKLIVPSDSDSLSSLLEGAFHLVTMVGRGCVLGETDALFVPVSFGSILVHPCSYPESFGEVHRRELDAGARIEADVTITDASGALIVEVHNARAVKPSSHKRETFTAEELLYEIAWKQEPLAQAQIRPDENKQKAWLIFSDSAGVGDALAEVIKRDGRAVVVKRGDQWRQDGPDRFQIRMDSADDIRRLLDTCVGGDGSACCGLVYLWGIPGDVDAATGSCVDSLERVRREACGPLLTLLKESAQACWTKPPKLWLVTSGAQAVEPTMGEGLRDAGAYAALWGLGRVVAAEHSELWGGLVDIDIASPDIAASALWQELRFGPVGEQVAWRGSSRYVARLQRSTPTTNQGRSIRFKSDATYLVTGGLGSLGFEMARWMVSRGARRFLLVGRTELPLREHWNDPLASAIAERVARVRALEALGASVHLASIDIAEQNAVSDLLRQFVRQGWPTIRGVVHTAASIRDQLLCDLDPESWQTVFHAKVLGAMRLHEAFAEEGLDFFLLFSSLGSVLGQEGQGSYAAANAVLDALAHHRRCSGLPALSLSWGPWEVGFARSAGGSQVTAKLSSQGIQTLSATKATEAAELALSAGMTHALVAPIDWARFADSLPSVRTSSLTESLVDEVIKARVTCQNARPTASFREQLERLPQAERYGELLSHLKQQLAQVLKITPARIHEQKPFGALGLTSLLGLEYRTRLEQTLTISLPATLIWNYPTLTKLVDHLLARLELADAKQMELPQQQEDSSAPVVSEILAEVASISDDDALRALRAAKGK